MLRMTMCIVRNAHVSYQRILSSSGNETPHRVGLQDWVPTHSCYWVPLIRSTNASVVSLVRSPSDHQSQSVKNPLCTLLHSWLNQQTCKITPSAKNLFPWMLTLMLTRCCIWRRQDGKGQALPTLTRCRIGRRLHANVEEVPHLTKARRRRSSIVEVLNRRRQDVDEVQLQ